MATRPTEPRRPQLGPVPGGPEPILALEPNRPSVLDYSARALLIWPGLDRARLATTRGDPHRIARLVARRTNLPHETILRMLGVRHSSPTAR
jgi:hypothetical protein